jgi:ABC-type multidrug transport system fused ATPase/permease subunit
MAGFGRSCEPPTSLNKSNQVTNQTLKTVRWITNKTLQKHWFKPYPKVGGLLVLGWIASLSTFFLSLMVGWFYELHFRQEISKSALLGRMGLEINHMETFFILMGATILIKFSLQGIERYGINRMAERFCSDLIGRLYRKQISWKPELFEQRPFGKYLLRYSGDLTAVRGMLVNGIHRGIRDGLFLITGLAFLFWINSEWTFWLIGFGLLLLPVFLFLDKKQVNSLPEKQNSKNELLSYVTTSFAKQRVIFEKGNSEYNFRGFRRRNRLVLSAALEYQKWESLRHALINASGPLLIGLLLGILHFKAFAGSPAELLTFLLVLAAMVPAFRNVVKAPNQIEKGLLSLSKIERLMRKKEKIKDTPTVDSKVLPLSKSPMA